MKKLLALMMALLLMLSAAALSEAAPAPAEASEDEMPGALPQPGDVIHGFEVVEIRDYPLINAEIVRFEHQKTGAALFYIANDDTNRAFDLTFFTEAIDNTGLPHVFEHATLGGSKKYPSSTLFMNLTNQTYNTYMNAMTSKRYTSFPIASLSEAQLLKLADYYTDSCFNPMIMEDESIFRREAWRYRLESADDPLTIEGTVYSEMLGATTLKRRAGVNLLRAMFPGSYIGNDSGGDPDFIPDMTYEMLRAYHDRYYHPSNCAAYLYGQFEDYGAFLELLDGYFSAYERAEIAHGDEGYVPIAEPVVQSLPFAMEDGSDTEHTSMIYYGFVCPGLQQDPEQELLMNTLTDLLADNASAMEQRLQEALPYGSFGSYIEMEGPEDAIVFWASNVNAEDAEVFRQIVDESLADVAAQGFLQEQVDGVMTTLTISALLVRESSDPVENTINGLAYEYACNGNPWSFVNYQEGLRRMDAWNQEGLYAKAVGQWLVGSQTTALVTTYPEPGAKEQHDAALAGRLAEIKADMSEAEIGQIVESTNAETPDTDNSAYLDALQAVTVASLPEEMKLYLVTDEADELDVRHIDVRAGVAGIGMADIFLDASGLPQADLHWAKLYLDMLCDLDTESHDRAALATLMSRYLYGEDIGLTITETPDGGYQPYLSMCWIALDEDLDEGYELMRELLFETKLDDPEKLLEQIQSVRAGKKSAINRNPASTLLVRSLARDSEKFAYQAYVGGLDYYAFLDQAEQLMLNDPAAAMAKLQGIQAYFNNRTNAVMLFAGNRRSIVLNRTLSDRFLSTLDAKEIAPAQYDFPVPARREALVIDSGAQYNLLSASFGALGLEEYDGALSAVNTLITDALLMPLLRDQYGVYTPICSTYDDDGLYIYAYRDPNIAETFDVLDTLPELIAGMDVDQATLDGCILACYSGYAMPQGELSGAISAATKVMQGKPQNEPLAWMRQLKQVTPETFRAYADMFSRLCEYGGRDTAGGAAAISEHAELFDSVLDPFGE